MQNLFVFYLTHHNRNEQMCRFLCMCGWSKVDDDEEWNIDNSNKGTSTNTIFFVWQSCSIWLHVVVIVASMSPSIWMKMVSPHIHLPGNDEQIHSSLFILSLLSLSFHIYSQPIIMNMCRCIVHEMICPRNVVHHHHQQQILLAAMMMFGWFATENGCIVPVRLIEHNWSARQQQKKQKQQATVSWNI